MSTSPGSQHDARRETSRTRRRKPGIDGPAGCASAPRRAAGNHEQSQDMPNGPVPASPGPGPATLAAGLTAGSPSWSDPPAFTDRKDDYEK